MSGAISFSVRFLLGRASLAAGLAALSFAVASVAWAAPKNWWIHIKNDRVADVKTMVSRGIDVNSVNAEGEPAIMQAIKEGAWQVFDLLAADRRTNVNAQNRLGETPLMYLAVVGESERARKLIQRGAEVNRLGWTPLQYAASRGHLSMVNLLLANDAHVNAPGPDGTTALMMAAFSGEQPIVQRLLDAGADPTMQTLQKERAADWARKRGFDDLGRKLDEVAERVLAYRDALRKQANQVVTYGLDSSWGSSSAAASHQPQIPAPDLRLDSTTTASGKAAQTKSAASRNDAVPESSGQGTSRYFDLKRFDEEVNP